MNLIDFVTWHYYSSLLIAKKTITKDLFVLFSLQYYNKQFLKHKLFLSNVCDLETIYK